MTHRHVTLTIAPGDVVSPVHAWTQASLVYPNSGATLSVGGRYTIKEVRGGYSGAEVQVQEQPGEWFGAHLFTRPGVAERRAA